MKVVLYAEGVGETGKGLLPAPGDVLPEELLGPAHVLVRRGLQRERRIPEAATQFVAPQRVRARQPKGSDLHHRQTLRQLLSWPLASRRPDLAVVFVDADGERARQRTLEAHVEGLPIPKVLAVAVQEFEAWLLADTSALAEALQRTVQAGPSPESLDPGVAKKTLNDWMAEQAADPDQRLALRREIAERCALDEVSRCCSAFATFLRALGEAAP